MQTLVQNARQVDAEMSGTGKCAKAVSEAIQRTYGWRPSGNGNQIGESLSANGWKQVDMTLEEALKVPGLVLVWEKTSSELGQKYGHTAITKGDGKSSISDFTESNTTNNGRTGLTIWAPPDAVT
jgi:hypothetical protein